MQKYKFDHDISIINAGDLHFGNLNCDRKAVQRMVDYIASDEHTFWVSTGDLAEVNLKSGKFFQYDSLPLDKEISELVTLLTPIAPKCLGLVESNHHDRLEKTTGLSIDNVLCSMLKIPFLGTFGRLAIQCGNVSYFVALHHGCGFGSGEGAKAANMMRLSNILRGYDVYLTGHSHCNDIKWREQMVLDRKHHRESVIHSLHACTGHYIQYDEKNSYAATKMLEPAPLGSTLLHLAKVDSSTKKKYSAKFWTP